ncbi:hypothetical protein, partial [Burkholderia gladioli]|uniref:hypothetical protein n=1 Tax=Burkholderia gladioli TaxID=28095 RepID=UPI001ABA205F
VGASHAVFASRDQGGYIVTDRSRYFNGLLSRTKRGNGPAAAWEWPLESVRKMPRGPRAK